MIFLNIWGLVLVTGQFADCRLEEIEVTGISLIHVILSLKWSHRLVYDDFEFQKFISELPYPQYQPSLIFLNIWGLVLVTGQFADCRLKDTEVIGVPAMDPYVHSYHCHGLTH